MRSWTGWLFYDVTHAISRQRHAIDRNRALTASALHYQTGPDLDYGLDHINCCQTSGPYVVLLHSTVKKKKLWPEDRWILLARQVETLGYKVVLPWGTRPEQERSLRISRALTNFIVPPHRPLNEIARLMAGAAFVVGMDTGLLHLAAALKVPLVGIYTASDPQRTGPKGAGSICVVGAKGKCPSVADVLGAVRTVLNH
jgi:heptosyltransferase-1